jgi:6-phosphogluconolactonase
MIPPPHHLLTFADRSSWASAAAEAVADAIAAARAGQALWLAVAGGTTPKPVLEALAALRDSLAGVTVTPSDDRQVPEDHPARNRAMIASALDAAGADVRALEDMPLSASPDVVVLGYGNDRHIASLFPAGEGMAKALNAAHPEAWALTTPDPLPPEAPFARASLTLGAILRARTVIVLATGEAKRATLAAALGEGGACGEAEPLSPLARLLSQTRVPVHIYSGP